MRSRKQTPPELNGDHVDDASKENGSGAPDALSLAEEAEAEAAEAEAVAAAARARARAIRLRREAEAAEAARPAETVEAPETAEDDDVEDDAKHDSATVVDADTKVDDADTTEAAEDTEAAADSADETEPKPAKERRGLRIPLPSWTAVAASITVLVIAALLAGCGYMYWYHRQAQAEQQRSAEFAAAARQGVVTLMSLDYNKAKEDVQRIIDNSTGQFKADFQNTADDFVKVATESKAVTETKVTATAVESMTDNTATVLVAATSRVTNAAGAKEEPRAWRLSVNLARDGDQIKLAKVEFVP
jgi:Mce-associated membrane protein